MRSYAETLDYLYSRLPMFTRVGATAFKKDLTNTLELCKVLGQPHQKFKSIHIAGTNGKGSSSHMLAAIFQEHGYKTGLYTSPHLKDFRERILIDGKMISEEEVIAFTDMLEPTIEQLSPSFFELTVAMAFDHFAKHQVDIAIIETGMGGRLDSTNIINPELSLITNIGWDHMDFLGNTLPEIAGEKAGIIKQNKPVVVGKTQPECMPVFHSKAETLNAPLYYADQSYQVSLLNRDLHGQNLNIKSPDGKFEVRLDLPGSYQIQNLPGVLKSVALLKNAWQLKEEIMIRALSKVRELNGFRGRWQVLSNQPLTICDTGHNVDGMALVVDMIREVPYQNLHFVLGMVKDKAIDKVLALLPQDAHYYFTQANIPRALEADLLAEQARELGLKGEVIKSVEEALKAAQTNAQESDLVFVGGSTFVVAEVV